MRPSLRDMEFALLILILVLAVASPLWGTDTRDGRDWQPRSGWRPAEEIAQARARAATPPGP